jgi:hypothetical protein
MKVMDKKREHAYEQQLGNLLGTKRKGTWKGTNFDLLSLMGTSMKHNWKSKFSIFL